MSAARAYLVDPAARAVSEVTLRRSGSPAAIKAHLGVKLFDFIFLTGEGDGAFIDDEGLYVEGQRFWSFAGSEPIPGRGLIVGPEGKDEQPAPPTRDLDWFRARITWPDVQFTGAFETVHRGENAVAITAVFRPRDGRLQ